MVYVILGSLVFSAFFSGMEIAFVSADRLQVELESKQGQLSGRILSKFINNPSGFIGTTLIGNTIALVVYGYFMALLLDPVIANLLPDSLGPEVQDTLGLVIQTVVSTLIVLVTAEFTPKSIFLINPNWLLHLLALPMLLIYWIMWPLVIVIIGASKWIIKHVLRQNMSEDRPVFQLTDLNNFIQRYVARPLKSAEDELVDARIFNNALEFKTIKIRDCMIPRTEMVSVDVEEGIEALKQEFIETGHSKILVYRDSIDDVIGYCHMLELFKKPKDIQSILTPIIIVPETMLANELLIQFITEHKSLALVVDEFGGTSGIVSMEDIIEQIFGEIHDEHDEEDLIEQQLDSNTWLLSARHEIDYLNDEYGWNLPEGDYDTLSGLILSENEDIPVLNQEVRIGPYLFSIQSLQGNRINTVKLHLLHTDADH
ncbi:cbs domain containing protein [Flammeovirgaceae bacterium 311]|nr:cbs domain containing protein [Flammeovirgaceae bacterium 311]